MSTTCCYTANPEHAAHSVASTTCLTPSSGICFQRRLRARGRGMASSSVIGAGGAGSLQELHASATPVSSALLTMARPCSVATASLALLNES